MKLADGKKITIKFEDFSLEAHSSCVWDYVEIRKDTNTGSSSGTLIEGRKCGYNSGYSRYPSTIETSTNEVQIIFRSDYSVTSRGFKIRLFGKNNLYLFYIFIHVILFLPSNKL